MNQSRLALPGFISVGWIFTYAFWSVSEPIVDGLAKPIVKSRVFYYTRVRRIMNYSTGPDGNGYKEYKERIFSLVQLREVNWPQKHANPANCRPIDLLRRDSVHIQCRSVDEMATIRGISCLVLILSSVVYANDGVPKEIGKISILIDISSR